VISQTAAADIGHIGTESLKTKGFSAHDANNNGRVINWEGRCPFCDKAVSGVRINGQPVFRNCPKCGALLHLVTGVAYHKEDEA